MEFILNHLSKQSKLSILTRAYLTVCIIAILDYFSGSVISGLVFYLIPILIVTWFAGRRQGLLLSFISSVLIFTHIIYGTQPITPYKGIDILIPLWKFTETLVPLIVITVILTAMKKIEEDKLQAEFKLAGEIQSYLLPQSFPEMKSLHYMGMCKSNACVSGDYYDFISVESNKLGIAVGDISGKGISGAMLMANLQGILRSFAPMYGENVVELMNKINHCVYTSTDSSRFVTLFYGVYDDLNHSLTYVNAGQSYPILYRRTAKQHRDSKDSNISKKDLKQGIKIGSNFFEKVNIDSNSTVLGAFPDATFTQHKVQLNRGDIIIIFSDGISDARDYSNDNYGEDRIAAIVEGNADLSPVRLQEAIIKDINDFVGEQNQFDDMTLVVAKVI